jgi:hypothetical protein
VTASPAGDPVTPAEPVGPVTIAEAEGGSGRPGQVPPALQGWTPPPDDPEAWTRAVALGRRALAPIWSVVRHLWLASGIGVGVAVALLAAGASPVVIAGGTSAVVVVAIALAALPFRDPSLRAATELVWNHQSREAREWKRRTGTAMPRGRSSIRIWLDARPDAPQRGTLLCVLGRFAEAEVAWRALPTPTPASAFAIELERETAMLFAGRPPDLARLHERWRRLPATRERADQRECLAFLEAQAGTGAAEAIAILAAASPDGPPIERRARVSTALAWNALIPVGVAVLLAAAKAGFG